MRNYYLAYKVLANIGQNSKNILTYKKYLFSLGNSRNVIAYNK